MQFLKLQWRQERERSFVWTVCWLLKQTDSKYAETTVLLQKYQYLFSRASMGFLPSQWNIFVPIKKSLLWRCPQVCCHADSCGHRFEQIPAYGGSRCRTSENSGALSIQENYSDGWFFRPRSWRHTAVVIVIIHVGVVIAVFWSRTPYIYIVFGTFNADGRSLNRFLSVSSSLLLCQAISTTATKLSFHIRWKRHLPIEFFATVAFCIAK